MKWLIAAHRGPTIAMVAISVLLAALVGTPIALSMLAILCGQLSVGWLNDLLDFPRDVQVGRQAKPLVNGSLSVSALTRNFWIAAGLIGPVSWLAFGRVGTLAHLGAVVSAWSYNYYFKRTLFSFLPYLISFALFPVIFFLATDRVIPQWLAPLGALCGLVIHFVNVWPDIDEDLATGVSGLPHRLVAFARDSSTGSNRGIEPRGFKSWSQWLRRRN